MNTPRSSTPRVAYVVTWLIAVALPMGAAGAAWLWIEVCKAMFIPGIFLALPGWVVQIGLAFYAAPLRWLAPELCFTAAGNSVVRDLPCDSNTWLALAALYTLFSLGLVAAARYVTTPSRP